MHDCRQALHTVPGEATQSVSCGQPGTQTPPLFAGSGSPLHTVPVAQVLAPVSAQGVMQAEGPSGIVAQNVPPSQASHGHCAYGAPASCGEGKVPASGSEGQ